MLKIQFREEEAEESHPLQAIAPWLNPITDSLILNKDGSILAGFDYRGLDPDDLIEESIDSVTEQLENVCKRFDGRVTAWWISDRRRDPSYIEGSFTNPTAAAIDKLYAKTFTDGSHYSTRYSLYLLYTGATGTDKFLDRIARLQTETGADLAGALLGAVRESLSGRQSFARDVGTLRDNVMTFERLLNSFANSVPISLTRLKGDTFISALGILLNRASNPVELKKPKERLMDAWLPRNHVSRGKDIMRFDGSQRSVFAAAIGVKSWPKTTTPNLFQALSTLDMEITTCQIVRFLDAGESTAAINSAIEYYKLTQYNLITHAMAKAMNQEPEPKPGRRELLEECEDALRRVGSEGVTFAYMAVTILVYGQSKRELKRNCDTVVTALEARNFNADREQLNTLPAFCSMLPGQWAMQSRYDLVSIENVADAAPIYTVDEGPKTHEFFSNQVYQRAVPQLTVFGNRFGGRFNFSSHVGQVGHMLIIAPTGGGKSTVINFCISQFQRYGNVRTIIFDRNRSCEASTKLHGGQHIDIKKVGVKLNPFAMMRDGTPDGQLFVREYLLRRLSDGGFVATSDERNEIDEALTKLNKSGEPVSMTRFAVQISKRLESQFSEWLDGGPYGMFDNEKDGMTLEDWTTIEMSSVMAHERLARAFIDLLFRKIICSLDGRPTLIYIEEASFLINNPLFAPLIDEWLKAVRGRGGFIWMTIQSPTSVTSAEMASSILDNIFSFMLLYNKKVESHRADYRSKLGLDDHQIDMVAKLQPKRDYLLIQDGVSRVMTTHFTPEVLAYLRSEKAAMNIFDQLEEEGKEGWQTEYLARVGKFN